MNNIDKFFEKKLADHTLTPSTGAWENIEARLSKKNKPVIWMRWAAVLLLGVLTISTYWLTSRETTPSLVKDNGQQPTQQPTEAVSKPAPVLQAVNKIADKPKKKSKMLTAPQVQEPITENQDSHEVEMEITEPIAAVEKQNTPALESKPAETVRPMVIVYTLDPVSLPDSGHATEELMVADKKDNSFKKVIKIAQEVKNSEAPLGGFRDMKEELLAFDLKKKSNSKKH